MKRQIRILTISFASLTVAACSPDYSGEGDSSSSGPLTVQFGEPETVTTEDATFIEVPIVLSRASTSPIIVEFQTVGGDATLLVDYRISTPSPIQIASGSMGAAILVQLFEDAIGEAHECVEFVMLDPSVGSLGENAEHLLIIRDDDADIVEDTEPNNTFDEAVVAGPIANEQSYVVNGLLQASAVEYDVFLLRASDFTDIIVTAYPVNPGSVMNMHILDKHGRIIDSFTAPAGEPVTAEYEAVIGESVLVAAFVEHADSYYELLMVGTPSTLALGEDGPGDERSLIARTFGTDWAGFREWARAHDDAALSDVPVTDACILDVVRD